MSQETVEKVLGRLLTDDQFRNRAAQNLELACRLEGYLLGAEELRLIQHSDFARISSAADSLDSGIRRFTAK